MNQATQPGSTATAASNATTAPQSSLERLVTQLRSGALLPLLIGGAAFIAIVVALIMWASTPEYRVLYSNLTEADGGRIVSELENQRIPYQLTGNGSTIMIPGNQVHRVRLSMAEQGLPHGGNIGFALMDNQSFGISQFSEQVNFQRSLEGELANSMESLGPVQRARVHLSMAKPSVFIRDREPAKASVVLSLHPGRTLADGQVMAIVHMVSSAVPELSADHVTVVDQLGNLLSKNGQKSDLSGTELTYTEEIERTYQRRIEEILAPILGRQNVRAKVVAQIDFSRIEETSERFTPNQTPETAAVRSIQSNVSFAGDGDRAQGVPGALSNTPPGVVTAPIETPAEAAEEEANGVQGAITRGQNSVRQDNIVNYEVDRNIAHIQHQRGRLERLSAAIVVNYRDGVDEEGLPVKVPLTDEDLARIDRLVRQAMGFSELRGDALEIVNSAFVTTDEEVGALQREWWEHPETQRLIMQAARYVLAGLGILLFYLLVMRPILRRFVGPVKSRADNDDADQEVVATRRSTFQAIAGDDDDASDPSDAVDTEEMKFNWPKKKDLSSYEQALKKTQEIARQKPRQVARIVQNWLLEDESGRDEIRR
ncbi:flagellar basal-body MS-ring/collar protein FliF [Aliidiomarina halalkaliphila]|nr:flagellar basal-body MS-ring/collar protein FliF [Aliidiomarina halalkaliphila]